MKKNNGFTLIEVIFVLGVLTVLLLLSAPIKVSILDNKEEQQFLTTLENDLLYMQSISFRSTDHIWMKIQPDSYTIFSSVYNSKTLLRRNIPTNWTIDLRTIQGGVISFNRYGTIREPGTIHLSTNKSTYRIVFPFGKGRCYIEKI